MKNLSIPTSSRQNYLGKAAIGTNDGDISLATANPALVDEEMKRKLLATTAFYFSSIYSNISSGAYNFKWDIPIVFGGNLMAYGTQNYVDDQGNYLGKINPVDVSFFLSASKKHQNYTFGLSSKLAYSNYRIASTLGVSFDASGIYHSADNSFTATVLLKNMGYQFLGINSSTHTSPFDFQIAISKRLAHLPFRYTILAQELYHWDASSNSTDYGIWPLHTYYETNPSFIGGFFSHFVIGGEFYMGKHVRFGGNYDIKKGQEASFDAFRGLTGLSLGFGIYTSKFDFGYSFSKITPISASHQFTFIINTNEWVLFRGKR